MKIRRHITGLHLKFEFLKSPRKIPYFGCWERNPQLCKNVFEIILTTSAKERV